MISGSSRWTNGSARPSLSRADPHNFAMHRQPLRPRPRGISGFTLIEVIIALVVVGILVAIALPSFLDSVRKGRRTEAFAALNSVQQGQERHRSNRSAYTALLTEAPTANPPGLGLAATTPGGYYGISLSNATATGYEVTATAASGTSQANDGNCVRLRVRMDGGNLFYGSAAASGAFNEAANNLCWKR